MDESKLEIELNRLNQEYYVLKAKKPYDNDDIKSQSRYQFLETRMNEIVDDLARLRVESRSQR
jgi:hypothetical protein